MKRIIIFALLLITVQMINAQASQQRFIPGTEPKCTDCLWGCSSSLNELIGKSELIFEGKILSDTFFCGPVLGACVYHKVLVLKQLKGNFKSDTIEIAHAGGTMGCNGMLSVNDMPNIHVGMTGVLFVVTPMRQFYYNNNANIYGVLWPKSGCGFVNVCDKKDVVKEVYEPIEAATGQKYVEVHPNTCAMQQKPKK